jgi:scyllo-inositol 2-dehydrogenase (NAD+)
MGTLHAENVRRIPGAELVAVASARAGRAGEVAAALGVAHCTYSELFARDDVDGIVLAARSVDHGRLALDVLQSGKHLFLEKPGATTMGEHDALRRESAARPAQIVQVGYMRRYDAGFVEAHRRLRAGEAGDPLVVLLTSRDTEWPEGEEPHATGGFLLDMASHDYDSACWLLGDEAVDVTAARQAHVYPELAGLGDLDNAVVTMRFAGGGLAVTHVSRTSPFGHDIRCEVVGTEASIFVRGPGDGTSSVVGRDDAHRHPADYAARFADAYVAELTAFIRACCGAGDPGPTLEDDRRAVAIGVAARASALNGRTLEVGPDWPWP